MGSRNPERDKLIVSDSLTIRDWHMRDSDWALLAQCRGCARGSMLYAEQLLRVRNPPYAIEDLKHRLTCQQCGCRLFQLIPRYVGSRRG